MGENSATQELLPKTSETTTIRETNLLTPTELRVIRKSLVGRDSDRLLLREASLGLREPLRSHLAAEFVAINNPAIELERGEKGPAMVAGLIGKVPDEVGVEEKAAYALTDVAKFGAIELTQAERELGPDGPSLIKGILRKGIHIPEFPGEYRDRYIAALEFLNTVAKIASIRYNSALAPEGERFRAETYRILETSPETGLILPDPNSPEPSLGVVLPNVEERVSPWKKIADYHAYLKGLDNRLRAGLEFATRLTPMGFRKVAFSLSSSQTADSGS